MLGSAAPAKAYTGPVTDPANIDDVLGYLTKGSPNAGQIPGIDVNSPRVSDWWDAEHRPIPGQPSSSQLHDDLRAARSRLGLLPKLGQFAKFTLTGIAATVAISYADDLFQEIGLWPSPTNPQPWEPVEIQLYEKGEYLTTSGTAGQTGDSFAYPRFKRSVKVGGFSSGGSAQVSHTMAFEEPQAWMSPQDWIVGRRSNNPDIACGRDLAIPDLDPPARRFFAGQLTGGLGNVNPETAPFVWPPWTSPCSYLWGESAFAVVQTMTEAESRLVPETDAPVVLHAPQDWAGECTTRACVEGALEDVLDDYPELAQYLEHLLDPENNPNPYPAPAKVIVPDCDGLLWPACKDLLQDAGLDPTRDALNWQGAVIERPAGAVVETQPAAGAEVDTGAAVTVVTNPSEDGMPVVMPEPSSDPNEHYQTFLDELGQLGFPAPLLQELTETTYNPERGPSAVASVVPKPGTRFDPSKPLPQPSVNVNPPTVPIVDDDGSCDGLALDTIDLSPLFVSLGDRFPFGLPGYADELFTEWSVSSAPPNFTVPLIPNVDWTVDFTKAEPALEVVRPVIVIVSAIGVFMATVSACWSAWARFIGPQGDWD